MPPFVNEVNSSSQPMIEETSVNIPFDLVEEILCRLPVKSLLQLRCVCKSWNSLISHHKFAKKHLSMSTTRRLHIISYSKPLRRPVVNSCPLDDVFATVSTNVTQLEYPSNIHGNTHHEIVGSCNGILCFVKVYSNVSYFLLWNPSIRKVKELPPLEESSHPNMYHRASGFGYDFVTDNYKVVAVLVYRGSDVSSDLIERTQVKVNTLGTNFWKNIQNFPFNSKPDLGSGSFVSGTINWLASERWREIPCFIVSLDLGNESYQKVLPPDYGEVDVSSLYLSVLRDCLCIIDGHDVWIMKEYGNKDSWTKLFSVSYMRDPSKSYKLPKAIYMFEDDQVLFESIGDWHKKLIVYDPKIGTFKFIKFLNKSVYAQISCYVSPEICMESLISPYF